MVLLPCLLFLLGACSTNHVASTIPIRSDEDVITNARAIIQHNPQGMVQMLWNQANQNVVVQVALSGLVPDASYMAHIAGGNCRSASLTNQIISPLALMHTNLNGYTNTITTIAGIEDGIPAAGWYVMVYNGVDPAAQNVTPVACSDVVNDLDVTKVYTPLGGTSAPNQAVSGTAYLRVDEFMETLTVTLSLQGLEPGSEHAAYIYGGSCISPGKIDFPLKTIVADDAGIALVETVLEEIDSIPKSGWYIRVHWSTDLIIQTGEGSIACGDVLPAQLEHVDDRSKEKTLK